LTSVTLAISPLPLHDALTISRMAKNHEVTPPSIVWNNIAQEIQKPQQEVHKKRFPFYASLSIAAAMLIFMGFALHIFYLKDGKRSEEHTSELQSRENLVCRLL